MDGGVTVTRTLPIDGELLSSVLTRLRRDARNQALSWRLGDHGLVEVDAAFVSDDRDAWSAPGRLWDTAGLGFAPVVVTVRAASGDTVELGIRTTTHTSWPPGQELRRVARAAVDELAEELLWHATREGVGRA